MSGICFDTACAGPRPVRLPEALRRWAWDSLHGRYGDEALELDGVSVDDIPGFDALPALERYTRAVERIAERAPLRVVPGEPVSGSATLGLATKHVVPARWRGEPVMGSVSHLTLDFESVVKYGVGAQESLVRRRLDEALSPAQRRFYESARRCLNAMRVWHRRYLDELAVSAPENAALLRQVPFGPARTFREGLQSVWFTFAFTRLTGNWPGIGRLDKMLGGLLEADLAAGRITLDEARACMAGFFIKGCEWVRTRENSLSGDAQNYQNLVLCGVDENGRDVTNEVSRLALEVVEELPIGDFPITIRLNEYTPAWLKALAARVVRHGGGVVAFYNEKLILDSLTRYGYPLREARNFANDGCWEIQVPGRTNFGYLPFDGLRVLLEDTLRLNGEIAHFDSYEALRAAYFGALRRKLEELHGWVAGQLGEWDANGGWTWREGAPCTVVSLFEGGCLESGRSYFGGGARYNVRSPHIGGAPDVGNSLYAIDRLCFRDRTVDFDRLMRALAADWAGEEALRQYALRRLTYYGNDDDEADAYTADVLDTFAALAGELDGRCGFAFPPGVSTFGRQIEWASARAATPFGRRRGDILSGNASPTPGTDLAGATAIIASYCKSDLSRQVTGAALDVKLAPQSVAGENGVTALVSLMDGFCALGGCFVQIDVVDAETLRRAQEDPETYRTLSVRVSGWNARFVTLSPEWQRMIIERTEHGL